MSATDALTITSALDALTRYYDAKEREENAVLYINDAYLEVLNSLEKLEAENAKMRELVAKYSAAAKYLCGFSHCNECNLDCASVFDDVPNGWDCARMLLDKKARELGIEVPS